jgi:hypothetical protein
MFVTTFFCLVVFQCEVRATYSKLYGIATTNENDFILLLGIISVFSLPCLAYFDTHTYTTMHSVFCVFFFVGCGFYLFLALGLLNKYKKSYPEEQWNAIDRANHFRWVMMGSVVVYYIFKWLGPDTHSAFYEWLLVFMYLAAASMLALTNTYLETIHETTLTK